MSRCKHGRHVPAFILLFLAREPAYGSLLLSKMKAEMPFNKLDSAAIYRALRDLEKIDAVKSYWDTSMPGPAKKWYEITKNGHKELCNYKKDIENRKKNLEFFLETYEDLK